MFFLIEDRLIKQRRRHLEEISPFFHIGRDDGQEDRVYILLEISQEILKLLHRRKRGYRIENLFLLTLRVDGGIFKGLVKRRCDGKRNNEMVDEIEDLMMFSPFVDVSSDEGFNEDEKNSEIR